MSARDALFYLYGALTLAGAVGIVRASRLVHAVVWLFATMVALAGIYLTLGSELLAGVQLFVYGGAVTVLALFALVLARPAPEVPAHLASISPWVAGVAATALLGALTVAAAGADGLAVAAIAAPDTAAIASEIFGRYVVLFEVAGLLLTVALVGSIVVARKDDAS